MNIYKNKIFIAKESNKKDKNPGILVETISGEGYSIPVVVIPGNLSDSDIDKLAGFDNL